MQVVPDLLMIAWLLPLASFVVIVLLGPRLGRRGEQGGFVATGAIVGAFVLSAVALGVWLVNYPDQDHKFAAAGNWYDISPPGIEPAISIGYYVDTLTVAMFVMVSLIASLIHIYAMGYMHEELNEEVVDHELEMPDGSHFHRPGRYHRFFQYMSLFCFSMLGLVIAGNIAMVFVFWELVGICSYFLIGFYYERQSASNAANKAFIVNRVGDFGMIIGIMALWGALGTFNFGDVDGSKGLFSLVRPGTEHQITVPAKMAEAANRFQGEAPETAGESGEGAPAGYWLLVVAGLGIFCGCVGKSAQFPLHTWLPDAMEGPTPVSALVHSATMVAAGVYLVGRFYPVFTPEVLLVIAIVGAITLFMAATIAITAVDIKRVLAYSTVSQLGYMMLGLGVGGWIAGLFHLITHAFFKSLLFMCSGSVIHACHTNDMRKMGGLRRKMPWTAYTMLAGCLAIAGAPFLSGFYSKDSIVAQCVNFSQENPKFAFLYYVAAAGAAITAFYMFRLWFMTFTGEPRDENVHKHAHESPPVMWVPLVVLSVFAVFGGFMGVTQMLEQAKPDGLRHAGAGEGVAVAVKHPDEHISHTDAEIHGEATTVATGTALVGFLLALLMYWKRFINAEEVRRQFSAIYSFLWHKWWFDELYNAVFVKPTLFLSRLAARFDRRAIDGVVDGSARWTVAVARFDDAVIDRTFVDGLVNLTANWIYSLATWLRVIQTGKLRQYVVFIVVGTVALFVLISFWTNASAN